MAVELAPRLGLASVLLLRERRAGLWFTVPAAPPALVRCWWPAGDASRDEFGDGEADTLDTLSARCADGRAGTAATLSGPAFEGGCPLRVVELEGMADGALSWWPGSADSSAPVSDWKLASVEVMARVRAQGPSALASFVVGGRNEVRDAAEERSGEVMCAGALPLDSPAAAKQTRARGRLVWRTGDRGTSSSCVGRSVEDVMKTGPRSRIEGTTVLPVGSADASDASPGTTSTGGLPTHHKDKSAFLPGPRITWPHTRSAGACSLCR